MAWRPAVPGSVLQPLWRFRQRTISDESKTGFSDGKGARRALRGADQKNGPGPAADPDGGVKRIQDRDRSLPVSWVGQLGRLR